MPDTLLRHWHMLRMIPRHPRKIATATLADSLADAGFEVNRRSIQRDLQKLSVKFPLHCDERSRPFGWSWDRTAPPFDVPGMDMHTALAFALAAEHLSHMLPGTTLSYLQPHFERATEFLDHVDDNELAAWRKSVRLLPGGQPMASPKVDEAVLESLHFGLLHRKALKFRYRPRGDKARDYKAHPQGLVYRDRVAYLVASINDYDNVVHFALHRFEHVEVLDEAKRALPDFDLDDYVRSGAFGFVLNDEPLLLCLKLSRHAAVRVFETPLSEDQTEEALDDGWVQVCATVPDTAELRVWIKGHGPQCVVEAPASLREEIAASAQATAALYEPRQPS